MRATNAQASGKYYVEIKVGVLGVQPVAGSAGLGFGSSGMNIASYPGNSNYSFMGFFQGGTYESTGFVENFAFSSITAVVNDVYQFAVDLTNGKVWVGLNNTWYFSGNPATGANPWTNIVSPALGVPLYPAVYLNYSGSPCQFILQPTAASQTYAPPSGFTPWG